MPWRHTSDWRYVSTILDLGTKRRWVDSFTPGPLWPQGNRPRCAVEKRKILPLTGVEPRSSRPKAVTIPTELTFLHKLNHWPTSTSELVEWSEGSQSRQKVKYGLMTTQVPWDSEPSITVLPRTSSNLAGRQVVTFTKVLPYYLQLVNNVSVYMLKNNNNSVRTHSLYRSLIQIWFPSQRFLSSSLLKYIFTLSSWIHIASRDIVTVHRVHRIQWRSCFLRF
jgi:hypothetical protein